MFKIRYIKKTDKLELQRCEEIGCLSLPIYYSSLDLITFLEEPNNIFIYGASIDKKFVGFIVYIKQFGKIHILSLACHPDYRRKKIGTLLITKLKEYTLNITLYVQSTNKTAIRFYLNNGFIKLK